MNDGRLQSALRELAGFLKAPRLWITFAAIVALFTVTGPFGTYEQLSLVTRLGYWLTLHALAWLVCMTFVVFADQILAAYLASDLMRMLAGGVVATPVIALVIVGVDVVARGDHFSVTAFIGQIGVALPVTLLMCLFVWLVMDRRETTDPVDAGDEASPPRDRPASRQGEGGTPSPRPRLLDRLKPEVRAAVLHVCVADHYIDVVTSRGHQLVLMRFADALLELDDEAGLQVHRSHWVANEAVATIISANGRLSLDLVTGGRVPVSRPYVTAVRSRFGDRASIRDGVQGPTG